MVGIWPYPRWAFISRWISCIYGIWYLLSCGMWLACVWSETRTLILVMRLISWINRCWWPICPFMEARQQKDWLFGLTFGGAAMNERSDVDALDRNKCADATRPRLLTVHCVSSKSMWHAIPSRSAVSTKKCQCSNTAWTTSKSCWIWKPAAWETIDGQECSLAQRLESLLTGDIQVSLWRHYSIARLWKGLPWTD